VGGCGLSATADSSPAVFRLRPFFMLHPTMLRNILAARLLILCEMEIENMSLSGGKKLIAMIPGMQRRLSGCS
jgi:hypothetical protein